MDSIFDVLQKWNWVQLFKNLSQTEGEIDHEIFSTIILSLQLIQEGQLSVSGEKMHNTG